VALQLGENAKLGGAAVFFVGKRRVLKFGLWRCNSNATTQYSSTTTHVTLAGGTAHSCNAEVQEWLELI